MTGPYDGPERRQAAARRRVGERATSGPWNWRWRRRRRAWGCLLWLATLLIVLLVLSLLFGGFQRGNKVGGGAGHPVRVQAPLSVGSGPAMTRSGP